MDKKILDYRLPEDYDYLVKESRINATKNKKAKLMLSDGLIIETSVERCFVNMMVFRILDYYGIKDNRKEYIFTGSYVAGEPGKYMDRVLWNIERDSYFRDGQSEDDFVILLPHILAEIKEVFYKLSIIINGVAMTDHSLFGYIKAYRENKKFKEMMDNPMIHSDDPPWVVDRKLKHMIEMFEKEIEIHPLSDFYRSGVKVNKSQLMQFFNWGLIPNYLYMDAMLDYPVTGGVLNGYNNKKDLHLSDNISRLALITLKSEVREPGAQTKTLGVLLGRARLNRVDTREVIEDCGSTRYKTVFIESKKELMEYRYKYFLNKKGTCDEYIDIDRHDLIGKHLEIRSIPRCDGEIICKKCYGANSKFAVDNSIFKVNANEFLLVIIASIMQGVGMWPHHMVTCG